MTCWLSRGTSLRQGQPAVVQRILKWSGLKARHVTLIGKEIQFPQG